MNLPKKRVRPRMGVRQSEVIRCAGHLQYIRSLECCVSKGHHEHYVQNTPTEAAHVRSSGEGGVGIKPGDNWTIPLCSDHHRFQHAVGEAEFERRYKIDMKSIAEQLWQISPAGKRYRLKHQHTQSV